MLVAEEIETGVDPISGDLAGAEGEATEEATPEMEATEESGG